jgi:hypothetical protein
MHLEERHRAAPTLPDFSRLLAASGTSWNNAPPLRVASTMGSAEGQEISRGRKIAAAAMMLGAAGIVAHEALATSFIQWPGLGASVALGAAGIGLTRRSVVSQVLSRGVAWAALFPSGAVLLVHLLAGPRIGGAMPFLQMELAATTLLALLLARPMLHTREARGAFAPKAFRRYFLAGSTAMTAAGLLAGFVALCSLLRHPLHAVAAGALSALLLTSATAVVRMRGWGIVLGTFTSVVLLVSAAFFTRDVALEGALVGAAAPALLLHLFPVLVARMQGAAASSAPSTADATNGQACAPVRYRVVETSTSSLTAASESSRQDDRDASEPQAPHAATLRT